MPKIPFIGYPKCVGRTESNKAILVHTPAEYRAFLVKNPGVEFGAKPAKKKPGPKVKTEEV